jgi:hypothetical protein
MDNNHSVPKRRAVGKRKKDIASKPTFIIFDFKAKRRANPAMSERDRLMESLKRCNDAIARLQSAQAAVIRAIEAEDKKGGRK